ncbi:hypothetical protein BM1_10907 [Bipolaris maydis]|nr:hypothetical protein BM1_10907 [Bipolaris maydis]
MSRFSLPQKSQRPLHRTTPKRKAITGRRSAYAPEEETRIFKFDEELQAEAKCQANMAPWHVLRSPVES